METQAAFVRANGTVELYAVADVYMYLTVVVCPRNTESDDALRLYKALDKLSLFELWVLVVNVLD